MEGDSESALRCSRQEGLGDAVTCSPDAGGSMAAAEPALSPKMPKFSNIHLENIVKTASFIIN